LSSIVIDTRRKLDALGVDRLALVFVVVTVLDGFSLLLARDGVHVEMLWPARGVILACCMLWRPKSTMPVLVTALLGGIFGEIAVGAGLLHAVMRSLLSIAGIAGVLFASERLVAPEIDFRNWRHLWKFLAIGWVTAAIVAIPGSQLATWQPSATFLQSWSSWSLSTILAYTIFAPSFVLLATMRKAERATPEAERRIFVANLCMLVLLCFVFSQSTFPAGFLIAVAMLAVAFYSETEGASIALLLTAIVALTATAMGSGPWTLVPGTMSTRVDAIQVFLAVLTIGIIPTAAAITERRKLQESLTSALEQTRRTADALRESEALYRLLAENASDIVIRTDITGEILYVAPSVERNLGYRPSDLVGRAFYDLLLPEDVGILRKAMSDAHVNTDARGRRIEYRARHGSGRIVWLESAPSLGTDARGGVCLVDIARDVTQRKEMEAALKAESQRAEAAAEAKAEFLANVSHDLKTPLTTVIGFADALNDYCDLDARARRFANRVRTASLVLLSTVNDILDFSRLERGKLAFEPRLFSLRAHLEETIDLFAIQAAEKGLRLALQCDPGLDSAEVFADPHRLRQVLINLIGNAVKFTDTGSVRLAVRSEDRPAQGRRLRCEVIDTGPGIDAANADRLFQRFSQVDSSGQRFGGTGLGLAICKAIISAMDGEIGVTSAAGRGACFWFEIPLQVTGAVFVEPVAAFVSQGATD
jgi:PAS domain S-box-containing protein